MNYRFNAKQGSQNKVKAKGGSYSAVLNKRQHCYQIAKQGAYFAGCTTANRF